MAGESTGGTAGKTPSGGKELKPSCVLTPEQTEGPYYVDLEMVRRDVTEDRTGVPLILRATIVHATTCKPISNAALDIWHCDAGGVYSGYTAAGSGGGGMPPSAPPTATPTATPSGPPPGGGGGGHQTPTDNLTFLRGVQLSDRHGVAELRTIYPGWYQGRAIHIHVKVHVGGVVSATTYTGGHVSHTGQLYFAEAMTEKIALLEPYVSNTTVRLTNDQDGIFANGGSSGLLTLKPVHKGNLQHGLIGTIVIGVDPDATPAAV
jgi:protocatechuate 3,4-dioxygenase beta subunit